MNFYLGEHFFVVVHVVSEACGECGINVYFNDKSDYFVISGPCIIGNVSVRGLCYSDRILFFSV